jgi:hypothetical protein
MARREPRLLVELLRSFRRGQSRPWSGDRKPVRTRTFLRNGQSARRSSVSFTLGRAYGIIRASSQRPGEWHRLSLPPRGTSPVAAHGPEPSVDRSASCFLTRGVLRDLWSIPTVEQIHLRRPGPSLDRLIRGLAGDRRDHRRRDVDSATAWRASGAGETETGSYYRGEEAQFAGRLHRNCSARSSTRPGCRVAGAIIDSSPRPDVTEQFSTAPVVAEEKHRADLCGRGASPSSGLRAAGPISPEKIGKRLNLAPRTRIIRLGGQGTVGQTRGRRQTQGDEWIDGYRVRLVTARRMVVSTIPCRLSRGICSRDFEASAAQGLSRLGSSRPRNDVSAASRSVSWTRQLDRLVKCASAGYMAPLAFGRISGSDP